MIPTSIYVDEGDEKLGPPTQRLIAHHTIPVRLHVSDVVEVAGVRYWIYRIEIDIAAFHLRAFTRTV